METQNRANEHALGLDGAAFAKLLTLLPLANYRAGETVLTAGSKSRRLLILKSGAVVVLKDSIEIARVEEPGAVFVNFPRLNQPRIQRRSTSRDHSFMSPTLRCSGATRSLPRVARIWRDALSPPTVLFD